MEELVSLSLQDRRLAEKELDYPSERMDQRYRLRNPTDFKRVRRDGKSYAHPLVVLVACPNQLDKTRFGVTTSHAFRKATDRNRAKRRLRHALHPFIREVIPGLDIVLIARQPLLSAPWSDLQSAVKTLLQEAGAHNGQGSS